MSQSGEERVSIDETGLFPGIKNAYNIAICSETKNFFLPLRLSNLALQQTLLGN